MRFYLSDFQGFKARQRAIFLLDFPVRFVNTNLNKTKLYKENNFRQMNPSTKLYQSVTQKYSFFMLYLNANTDLWLQKYLNALLIYLSRCCKENKIIHRKIFIPNPNLQTKEQ